MPLLLNSRVVTTTTALAMTAALGIGSVITGAQGAGQAGQQGQTGQGRAGGAAGGGGRAGGQAQPPARDTQAQPQTPGTGIISGSVTVDGSGTPVRRARVTLSGTELRGGRSTITNDQGAFTFSALPAGRFTLSATKAGYLESRFGAKKPGRPGTPIQLAAGQKMDKTAISLPKGGVITGVVVDDNGEPTPRTQVRVMRYVMNTGEKTLQQAGTDQTDDRGMYRVYGLLPGDYLVSAVPQNMNIGDIRQTVMAEVESLLQQAQAGGLGALLAGRGGGAAAGGAAGGGGGGGGGRGAGGGGGRGGVAGIDINQIMGGGRGGGGDLLARAQMLQEQLAQEEQNQAVYAPVYYPGTPAPSQASPVTLAIAEERNGVDFRLMLVPTATVTGTVVSPDGAMPQGTQITLLPVDQVGTPAVPGANTNQTRVNQDGTFTFREIPPGQYRVMARGAVRDPNAMDAAAGRGGRGGQGPGGGRGGPGAIQQVLWGSADVTVNGEDIAGISLTLQPGMTVTGRIAFDSASALPPSDLTTVRVNLTPRGSQQGFDMGGTPPATVDATGRFTIKGVLPGKYSLGANVAGGGRGGAGGGGRGGAAPAAVNAPTANWSLKSAVANGRDALDFGLVVEPNQDVTATILFGDKSQDISGTIQDTLGNPTADYFIILFAADKGYWVPQSRRIRSVRPGTDGKFSFGGLPAGDYRLTAVTDVEQGEWFDPAFLEQLANASIPVTVREGEKKVQDIKVQAGGGL